MAVLAPTALRVLVVDDNVDAAVKLAILAMAAGSRTRTTTLKSHSAT